MPKEGGNRNRDHVFSPIIARYPKISPYQTHKVNLDHNASFFAYHNQHAVIAISEQLIFLKNVYYDSDE